MSSMNYVNSIPVFQGAQGKYYVIDGYKYHVSFPIQWALSHNNGDSCGPISCSNCAAYGTIRGVFVGYCGTCLNNYKNYANIWRGNCMGGLDVNILSNQTIWNMYPYMSGVRKSQIGDEHGAIIEDEEDDEEDFIQRLELDLSNINTADAYDDEDEGNTTPILHYYNEEQAYLNLERREPLHHVDRDYEREINDDSDSETVVLEYEY